MQYWLHILELGRPKIKEKNILAFVGQYMMVMIIDDDDHLWGGGSLYILVNEYQLFLYILVLVGKYISVPKLSVTGWELRNIYFRPETSDRNGQLYLSPIPAT